MVTDADQKAIKDAFIQKSKENHPDTNPDDPEGAAHRFQSVVAAYEVLSDADQKRSVDESLKGGPASSTEWLRHRRKDGGTSHVYDDGPREGHRHIDVDMSQEAMKKRWSLYQKHWEREEVRLQELEELKTVRQLLDLGPHLVSTTISISTLQFPKLERGFLVPKTQELFSLSTSL